MHVHMSAQGHLNSSEMCFCFCVTFDLTVRQTRPHTWVSPCHPLAVCSLNAWLLEFWIRNVAQNDSTELNHYIMAFNCLLTACLSDMIQRVFPAFVPGLVSSHLQRSPQLQMVTAFPSAPPKIICIDVFWPLLPLQVPFCLSASSPWILSAVSNSLLSTDLFISFRIIHKVPAVTSNGSFGSIWRIRVTLSIPEMLKCHHYMSPFRLREKAKFHESRTTGKIDRATRCYWRKASISISDILM